jgi:protein-S-isoprenylcysteine O-methyltransferase Ste14
VFVFVLGVAAYIVFVAVFLWLIPFVGDWGLARTVSHGPASPAGLAAAVDLALVALFGLQHSIMARPGFKRAWTRLVPPEGERSVYVLCASLALALLLGQWRPIPDPVWTVRNPAAAWALRALSWTGFAVVLAASFHLSHGALFGLRQAWSALSGAPCPELPFRTPGLYRLVRHPLMLGFLLAFWCTDRMTASHLLFAGAMTIYIAAGTALEERDLVRALGAAYRKYQEQVPRFLPWPRRRR